MKLIDLDFVSEGYLFLEIKELIQYKMNKDILQRFTKMYIIILLEGKWILWM